MADSAPELFGAKRRLRLVALAVFAVFLVLIGGPSSAFADPGTDGEGGTQAMRGQLETAARGYYDAKAALDASQARQATLVEQLRTSELALARLTVEVGTV